MTDTVLAIILAAGQGTRMKSALPKVMHHLAGAPLLAHVLHAAKAAGIGRLCLVSAAGMEKMAEVARSIEPEIAVAVQPEPLGTADAVKAALAHFADFSGAVLVLYGDTPLLKAETLTRLRGEIEGGAHLVVIGFEAADPGDYGRLLLDETGGLVGIREAKDASEAERELRLCNSGIMGFGSGSLLARLLGRVGNANAKREYYLTDTVELANADGLNVRMLRAEESEVLGVNSRRELAEAEAAMQQRLRTRAMAEGVTLVDPGSVFLSHDTKIGKDVLIEQNVIIGPNVVIGDNVVIRAFCHIAGARIGANAVVGPFARLRPGTVLAAEAHIGNFVEIKQAEIGEGAKVNHLTYVGDASIGDGANVGAGTITCNYDGIAKHRTEIGTGAFIGSNSSLVAPVKIGDGAYVGSGSVITKDVPADALALTRAPLTERPGWAAKRRKKPRENGGNNRT